MASATPNRLSEHLPLLAFSAAWLLQITYFLGYDSRLFFTFGFGIVAIIVLAVLAYAFGFVAVRIVPVAQSLAGKRRSEYSPDPRSAKVLMWLTIVLSAALIALNILIPLAQGLSLSGAREVALENWESGTVITKISAVLTNVTIAFCLMAIIDQIDLRKKFPIFLVLLFVMLTIAAYSRAHLLLGLSIISTKWLSVSKYRLPFIFAIFMLFAGLFSILSVITSVGSADRAGGIEDMLKSVEVYAFGGVAGFEFFYNTGYPQYESMLTLPRFVYSIFPGLGKAPPSYFPFVNTVPPINVFSALYPPYHDFEAWGVAIFFFAYGTISSIVATAFDHRKGRFLCVISGFMLYAALMSPFDDQFIRGLTILILLLSGTFIYSTLHKFIRDGFFSVRSAK